MLFLRADIYNSKNGGESLKVEISVLNIEKKTLKML